MIKIGEVSKQTGLSVSNIRFYEKKGLLEPVRDTDSRYREYSETDIQILQRILLLRKMDISVEVIYLLLYEDAPFDTVLHRQEEVLNDQMAELQGALNLCKEMQRRNAQVDFDVDWYLEYVNTKEAEGEKFAFITEIVEDVSEYTENIIFAGGFRGLMLYAGKYNGLVKSAYVLLWLGLAAVLLYGIITASLTIFEIIICAVLLFEFMLRLWLHRKRRRAVYGNSQ